MKKDNFKNILTNRLCCKYCRLNGTPGCKSSIDPQDRKPWHYCVLIFEGNNYIEENKA